MRHPRSDPRRIVTLFPAATELAFVLGVWDRVVGVSHECDFPPDVAGKPRVTRARLNPRLPTSEFDAKWRAMARNGESLYEVDVPLLQQLQPDLVVAQGSCEACAVSPSDLQRIVGELKTHPDVIQYGARTYEEHLAEIRRIGGLLHRPLETKREVVKQWSLAKEIRAQTQALPRPRVAVLDWIDPPTFGGRWTQELAEMANAEYSLVPKGQPSRVGSWEEIEEYEPDVILAAPRGRPLEAAGDELATAVRAHELWDLAPVEQGRLFVCDGTRYFNRPGPRLVYSAALLARAVHYQRLPELPPALEQGLARLEVPKSPAPPPREA